MPTKFNNDFMITPFEIMLLIVGVVIFFSCISSIVFVGLWSNIFYVTGIMTIWFWGYILEHFKNICYPQNEESDEEDFDYEEETYYTQDVHCEDRPETAQDIVNSQKQANGHNL